MIPGNVAAFRPAPADIAALKRFARSRPGRAFQALFDAYIPSVDSPLAALDDTEGSAGLPPLPPHMPDTPEGLLAGALGVPEEALPAAAGAFDDDDEGLEGLAAPVERPCCAEAELPVFFIPGLKLVLPVQARCCPCLPCVAAQHASVLQGLRWCWIAYFYTRASRCRPH